MPVTGVLILARQLSTSTVRFAGLVKPPIAVFGIEGRYATALYSAASKQKKLDNVENDLKKLKDLLKKDEKLAAFLLNPLIKGSFKKETVSTALKKQNYNELVINLLGTMADNGRLSRVESVVNSFTFIMSTIRGETVCEVTTAKALDATTLKELQDALQGFLKKGQVLKLNTKVDPQLIGGMTVSVGDKFIDMSTASKIKLYTNLIRESV